MNEAVLEKGLLGALRLPKEGRIYDLDPGRFPGMPQWSGHPTFQIVSYRTPKGLRIGGDQAWLGPEHNAPNIAFMSELIITGCHIGAHIDALAHITCGPDDHWYGGDSANTALGDFGPTTHDASTIPPIISRGVLVDVARSLGVERLSKSYPISLDEFKRAVDEQQVEIRSGDVVLIRTGLMSIWPDKAKWDASCGSGITLPVADWLLDQGISALGSDTEAVEVMPSGDPHNPHPVHLRMLIEEGKHLLECLYLEALGADSVREFLLVVLSPKVSGGTGSWIRPVAIV
jgi:kynurenine formamidase